MMANRNKVSAALTAMAAALVLTACGGGGETGSAPTASAPGGGGAAAGSGAGGSGSGGSGGGSSPPIGSPATPGNTGLLRVALTDAPACGYEHVYITVDRVRVHASSTASDSDGGWSEVVVNPPQRLDLLELTNGVLAELGQVPLPAGEYTQVRLVLKANGAGAPANAVVPDGGGEVALDTPSAARSGLKINHRFTVQANTMADLLLDFDACKSIVRAGNSGKFLLKPVVAAIPRTTTAIVGNVDPMLTGVLVSAQKDGKVVRSTAPNANGEFVLSGLDVAKSPFDVVLVANGRATAVIAATPVAAAANTRVSTTATPITLPASTVGVASGKVLPLAAEGEIRVLQAVGTVPKVEVAHANVDAMTAAYKLNLPREASRLAVYTATLPLTFAPQNATAAAYTLEAYATGYVTQTKALTVGAAEVVNDFTLVVAP